MVLKICFVVQNRPSNELISSQSEPGFECSLSDSVTNLEICILYPGEIFDEQLGHWLYTVLCEWVYDLQNTSFVHIEFLSIFYKWVFVIIKNSTNFIPIQAHFQFNWNWNAIDLCKCNHLIIFKLHFSFCIPWTRTMSGRIISTSFLKNW